METPQEFATKRAAAGAEFLDHVLPSWIERSGPGTLEQNSFDDCVLCQAFGSWNTAIDELHARTDELEDVGFYVTERNLRVNHYGKCDVYAALTQAWRDEIAKRRPQCST